MNEQLSFSTIPALEVPSCNMLQYNESSVVPAKYTNDPNASEHPFANKNVVIVGIFSSLSMERARLEILNCGGFIRKILSSKVDFLVIGAKKANSLKEEDKITSNKNKAANLIKKGYNLKVISENEFLSYLNNYPRFVKSKSLAELILLQNLGLAPLFKNTPQKIYFKKEDNTYTECKVKKIVSESPKTVEIEFDNSTAEIDLNILKDMQPTDARGYDAEALSNDLLNKLCRLVKPQLLTHAQLQVKKVMRKTENNLYNIVLSLSLNSYRNKLKVTEFLVMHIKSTKDLTTISFAAKFKPLLENFEIPFRELTDNSLEILWYHFWDLLIDNTDHLGNFFNELLSGSTEYSPFDCCSRYMECSNKKSCIHPDYLYASGACNYKKQLENGRIFYGKNRNV